MNPDRVIIFKEWLPDQPPLDNPGLNIAENVIPVDETYKSYATLTAGSFTSLAVAGAMPYAQFNPTSGAVAYGLVVGTATDLFFLNPLTSTFGSIRAGTYNASYWRFAQFDNVIIGANGNDIPQRFTIGSSASTLGSSSGTAPPAQQVAVINRFVMLGDISSGATGFHSLQWSGIDDYDSFPTPNSATAIAQQSGLQVMPADGGTITAIAGGDQFGIIFQRARVSRATYVGPPVVFQFDPIEVGRGCFYPNSIAQVKGKTYFASGLGFFVTDGVTVAPIGDEKIDRYFSALLGSSPHTAITSAVDYENKCVMWSLNGNKILHYNFERNKWTVCNETVDWLVSGIQRS